MTEPSKRSGLPAGADMDEIVRRALQYPFAIPADSYVLAGATPFKMEKFDLGDVAATVIALDSRSASIGDVRRELIADGVDLQQEYFPVIASGSNASPEQLKRKFRDVGDSTFIPVLKGNLRNGCSVYSAHFASYGSIAATTAQINGSSTESFCTLLPKSLLGVMHKSEAIGKNYGFYKLSGMDFEAHLGPRFSEPYAYLSLWGCLCVDEKLIRLSAFPYNGPDMEALDEPGVVSLMRQRLGVSEDIQGFVLRIVQDAGYRASIIKKMSEEFGALNAYEAFERIE